MNNDVSQDILNAVIKDFEKKYKSSKAINKLILKIDNGTASHMDSYQFAQKVSDFPNYAIKQNITEGTLPYGK